MLRSGSPFYASIIGTHNWGKRRHGNRNRNFFWRHCSRAVGESDVGQRSYGVHKSMFPQAAWAASGTAVVGLIMYFYQNNVISDAELHALGLSTLAGLSTTIGALFAVVRKPNDATLAFLLGLAVGVMATLSVVELWIKNGIENGVMPTSTAVAGGVLLYRLVQPYFPEFEVEGSASQTTVIEQEDENVQTTGREVKKRTKRLQTTDSSESALATGGVAGPTTSIPASELFRLGLLMAFTMTLHNMPEGLAVAFSAYTGLGWVMALAIAMHNIPEGIIVAAPIYAATGSRLQALGIATLSGLSEPLGALLALLFVKPFLTMERLHLTMAFMGGIMLAVCLLELWPEARKCKNDLYAWQGIALGAILMFLTLAAEV